MNITFIYPDFMKGGEGRYYEGLASLAATLEKDQHNVRLFHLFKKYSKFEFIEIFKSKYKDTNLAGFSVTTNAFYLIKDYVDELKKIKIPIIFGGVHPTLRPQEVIELDGVNFVCRGEAESVLTKLCKNLEEDKDILDIEGLWIKYKDKIIKNQIAPLVENLDSLPFPKRDIFDYYASVDAKLKRLVFMASRGCPFNCSYCANLPLRELFKNKEKWVRFKSVSRIIKEIKEALIKYPNAKEIDFHDDIFGLNKIWLEDFCINYKKEISLPYICNSRFEFLLDKKILRLLKESGCVGVKVGVESGNDFIRKKILNRNQDRDLILKVAKLCEEVNLAIYTFNMIGIPYENLKSTLDTVKLNALIRPLQIQVSIFYPYPNTFLGELCKKEGIIKDENVDSYGEEKSILKLKDYPDKHLVYAFRNFKDFVRIYSLVFKFPKVLRIFFEKILDFFWLNLKGKILKTIFFPYLVYKEISFKLYSRNLRKSLKNVKFK
ncbi:MAG: B12-binding domain-containing radical SAM protein [Candidatus Omnitrophica bacterium]|nr:B12-binding domain-containing radical SAM protein [Candidatus Omnitrophota bacterium]